MPNCFYFQIKFNLKINSTAPVCVGSAENSKWIILARPAADYDNLTKNQTYYTHNKISPSIGLCSFLKLCNYTLGVRLTVHAVILMSPLLLARLSWWSPGPSPPSGGWSSSCWLSQPLTTVTGQQPHLHCVEAGGCPATTLSTCYPS